MQLLAIDIGASSGRALLGELGADRLAFRQVHRFRNEMVERAGHKHWDIARLGDELLASLRNAGPRVEAVGIDTWGVDYGYVSKSGEVMGLPFAYRDERTLPVVERVHARLGGRERLYAVNGLQVMPFNTIEIRDR